MDENSIDLVDRCRQGDQDASREIFERYVARLISLVHRRMSSRLNRRVDAEDVVQSAFRSFFAGVDQNRFQFDQSGDLWKLLVVVSLNKLRRRVAHHRAAKRGMDREQSVARDADSSTDARLVHCFEAAASEPLPDAAAAVMDELALLTSDMDETQSEIVQLRLQGYEMLEIADQIGRSERTVRRVLSRVREQWQDRLSQEFGDDSAS
ncbi:MAG: sigma-70 family RNA polymerase sigma factor [Planctomycetota bacterium]